MSNYAKRLFCRLWCWAECVTDRAGLNWPFERFESYASRRLQRATRRLIREFTELKAATLLTICAFDELGEARRRR